MHSPIQCFVYDAYIFVEMLYCDFATCQNGGTCKEVQNDYQCECQSSYEGRNCEIGKSSLNVIICSGLK